MAKRPPGSDSITIRLKELLNESGARLSKLFLMQENRLLDLK